MRRLPLHGRDLLGEEVAGEFKIEKSRSGHLDGIDLFDLSDKRRAQSLRELPGRFPCLLAAHQRHVRSVVTVQWVGRVFDHKVDLADTEFSKSFSDCLFYRFLHAPYYSKENIKCPP
jgi:hypothetical protein